MSLKKWAWLIGGVSAGMLLYGAFVEAERLVLRRQTLRLKKWPASKNGFHIALIADFHLRDRHTVALTKRAVAAAIADQPDVIVIAGDFVGYWKPESPWLIGEALEALRDFSGRIIAVPGNHDYWAGDAVLLEPICQELGITLLRNSIHEENGIRWLGIDSFNAGRADLTNIELGTQTVEAPKAKKRRSKSTPAAPEFMPTICIWHEPDAVRHLPPICDLMISGHSHGGQFVFPGGFIPMKTKNGSKYIGGFYPNAPTPLFVTRGIGTTGPPSRFLCPPEVVLLTLSAG